MACNNDAQIVECVVPRPPFSSKTDRRARYRVFCIKDLAGGGERGSPNTVLIITCFCQQKLGLWSDGPDKGAKKPPHLARPFMIATSKNSHFPPLSYVVNNNGGTSGGCPYYYNNHFFTCNLSFFIEAICRSSSANNGVSSSTTASAASFFMKALCVPLTDFTLGGISATTLFISCFFYHYYQGLTTLCKISRSASKIPKNKKKFINQIKIKKKHKKIKKIELTSKFWKNCGEQSEKKTMMKIKLNLHDTDKNSICGRMIKNPGLNKLYMKQGANEKTEKCSLPTKWRKVLTKKTINKMKKILSGRPRDKQLCDNQTYFIFLRTKHIPIFRVKFKNNSQNLNHNNYLLFFPNIFISVHDNFITVPLLTRQ